MKKGLLLLVLTFCSIVGMSQDSQECDKVLLLGFNTYSIFTQDDLNSAYAEMFSKTDIELDQIARTHRSGSGASASLNAIAASWSKNKNDSSWRKQFKDAREEYQKSGTLNTAFIQQSSSQTVNDATVAAWRDCKRDQFESASKQGLFAITTAGDITSDFTFTILLNPQGSSENKPAKIKSVTYGPTLVPNAPNNLKKGQLVFPWTGISQSFTRLDKNRPASITVNFQGEKPIVWNVPADRTSSSGFPIGTIIASTLAYADLCNSLQEKTTFDVKNTWAPADGRGVAGSLYGDINNVVPDLRGVFLRGLNQLYPGNNGSGALKSNQLDIQNARTAGDFQGYATAMPQTPFSNITSGSHTHTVNEMVHNDAVDGLDSKTKGSYEHRNRPRKTTSSGDHTHTISGGDAETRPKNIAVYYYIKIN